MKFLTLIPTVFALGILQTQGTQEVSIPMKIFNYAGSAIDVFWVNVFANKNLVQMTNRPLRNSTSTIINTFEGHEFLIRLSGQHNFSVGNFVKGPEEESILINPGVNQSFEIKILPKNHEVRSSIRDATKYCINFKGDEFSNCVANILEPSVVKLQDDIEEMSKIRDASAYRLRNYTCADKNIKTSEPIGQTRFRTGSNNYKVNHMFETKNAKIFSIDDFVTTEECANFINYGKSRLQRATVAAEDGTSTISTHRKAQQAGYDIHTRPGDHNWGLYHRILNFTNAYNDYHLIEDGQEDFTIIQYGPGDQYTPHCDGACTGGPVNVGGRIATAVLYCKVADYGGGTSFSKADVFVQPKVGQATFFSYLGPDGEMDNGFTEHSGCPVYEGEKWIITFWMRAGVTRANPWTVYDPTGVPILDSQVSTDAIPDEQDLLPSGDFDEDPDDQYDRDDECPLEEE